MNKIFFLSVFFFLNLGASFAQFSLSGGFSWSNEPWNPDGYAINTDYAIPLKNSKFIFKPNIGFKNMKNYEDYLEADLQNLSVGLNASIGLPIVKKENYKLIPYLGPSLRYNKFSGKLYNDMNTITSYGSGGRYIFRLDSSNPENSIDFVRFGYALQVENQFKIKSKEISFTPFLEPDISFDPNSAGFYLTYYF